MDEYVNLNAYVDLTDCYTYQPFPANIKDNNSKKFKISINDAKISDKDFSQLDDLIIYFPDGFRSEQISFEDCKFKKLTILNPETYKQPQIRNINFVNCEFDEKITINLNNFIIGEIGFRSNDEKQISLDLKGNPNFHNINLILENINLNDSNFDCTVKLTSNEKLRSIDIKGCRFSNHLTIAGVAKYCFNNFENRDDRTKNKNTEFTGIELKENCRVKIFSCQEDIGNIVLSGDANTLELRDCKKISGLLTNKNSRIIINKGLELDTKYEKGTMKKIRKFLNKNPQLKCLTNSEESDYFTTIVAILYKQLKRLTNSEESYYFTTIGAIDIDEGGNFFHLVNCEIENTNNLAGDFESGFILDNVKFSKAPTIGNIAFKNCNVEIRDVKFEQKKTSKAIGGFRSLNQACHKANYEMGVIFFHGLELEARYNSHLKNIDFKHRDYPEKILSYLNKKFTDYGRNLSLPIWYNFNLSIIFFFFAIIFVSFDGNSLFNTAKLAFQNFLGPMEHLAGKDFACPKFYNSLPFLLKAFSFINKLFSYGIWIVWFFMIRRRFKI